MVGGWGVSYPNFFWIFIFFLNIYKAPKPPLIVVHFRRRAAGCAGTRCER